MTMSELAAELSTALETVRVADEELREERERLVAILDHVPAGIVMIDARSRRLVFANELARTVLKLPVSLRDLPEDWPLLRTLETGEAVEAERIELVDEDGGRIALDVSSAPVEDATGRISGAVAVFQPVNARQRRAAAEREFVSNAAHELRTPLAAIAGAIELLQSGAKDDVAARDLFLGHIEKETDRLQRLVRAMLTLARAQTQEEAPRLEVVELCPLLEEVAGALEPSTEVEVSVDCPSDLAAIANPDLLERVVSNLAENAAQQTSAGRIVLRAVAVTDETVELSVSDTGSGVPPAERDRMFDRFFRGRARDGEGFGLGLAIVSESVRALGGTIDVDSLAGGGTTIRVRLRGAKIVGP
jgi:two-component system phosphate regulon sensor histidine kinase PhoR